MSPRLIKASPDLQRLVDEGYEVGVQHDHLVLTSIPYVNARREVAFGTLVCEIDLNGERTAKPKNHQVWFVGETPCTVQGKPLEALSLAQNTHTVFPGMTANFRFSNKPKDGYPDYHAKMTRYVDVLCHHAQELDPGAAAQTFKPIVNEESEGPLVYTDTASSRAGITNLSHRLAMKNVGIIGVGGSGAYALDHLAKTLIERIHLYDGDRFMQHSAFRSPGATSLEVLATAPYKVDHHAKNYGVMHTGIVPHPIFITEDNLTDLAELDFVFIAVDQPVVRRMISEFLRAHGIPFIDMGIDVRRVEGEEKLFGSCRVTLCTPERNDHFDRFVSQAGDAPVGLYGDNIQIADLNAMTAVLAVIKWKKYCEFYQDIFREHQSVYDTNLHHLTRDAANDDPNDDEGDSAA